MKPLSLTQEEQDRIIAALSMMQEVDDQVGQADEARKTRDLIDRIQSGAADHD